MPEIKRVIWKYPLPEPGHSVTHQIPARSKIVSVQMQSGEPCMWVMVDPDEKEREDRTFFTVGTGHPFDHNVSYVGTWLEDCMGRQGALVWHVLERL